MFDESIIIKQADKVGATMVITKVDYVSESLIEVSGKTFIMYVQGTVM